MGNIQTVKLRNVEIGAGIPKIIVPIVAKTAEGIWDKAREILDYSFDFIEWRVDFYEDVPNPSKVLSTLKTLRSILGEKPILVTVRTKEEGGAAEMSLDSYTALNTAVAQSGDADIIDVQIFSGDDVVRKNIDALLDATQEMHTKYADRPIITMSMGSGVISRLCGECLGSAATFGMIGQASAPGQIPTEQLSTVLSILHQSLVPEG